MIDIDNFKKINDTYGHLVGDEVIRTVCDILKDNVGEKGMCIRYGGDEFAVLLQNHSLNDAAQLLDRVRTEVNSSQFSNPEVKTSISIGVATITEPADFKTLIKNADDVLRVSKETGKNKLTTNKRSIRNESI